MQFGERLGVLAMGRSVTEAPTSRAHACLAVHRARDAL